jgi:hypothetical protein
MFLKVDMTLSLFLESSTVDINILVISYSIKWIEIYLFGKCNRNTSLLQWNAHRVTWNPSWRQCRINSTVRVSRMHWFQLIYITNGKCIAHRFFKILKILNTKFQHTSTIEMYWVENQVECWVCSAFTHTNFERLGTGTIEFIHHDLNNSITLGIRYHMHLVTTEVYTPIERIGIGPLEISAHKQA